MLKYFLKFIAFLFVSVSIISCNNDDDGDSVDIELNDRNEQALVDEEELITFLKTHSFNKEAFEADETLTDQDIVFIEVSDQLNSFYGVEDEENNSNVIEDESIAIEDGQLRKFSHTYFDSFEDKEITQSYYVYFVRQGSGQQVHEARNLFTTYQTKVIINNSNYLECANDVNLEAEVSLTENVDESVLGVWFDNYVNILGFQQATAKFKTATPFNGSTSSCAISGQDAVTGNIEYNDDFGIGIVFIPSGLGYFGSISQLGLIENGFDDNCDGEVDSDDKGEEDDGLDTVEVEDFEAYRNLVFTFSTLNIGDRDHDGDGIPSYLEDINGDGDVDNDDTDDDDIPDFLDPDDDDDGTNTIFEITFMDSDNEKDTNCDGNLENDDDVHFVFLNDVNEFFTRDAIEYIDEVHDEFLNLQEPLEDLDLSDLSLEIPVHLDSSKDDISDYEEEN